MTLHVLSLWAQEKFKLPVPPSRPTISRILQLSDSLPLPGRRKVNKFPSKSGENLHIERALYSWVKHCFNRRIAINGPMIKTKAAAYSLHSSHVCRKINGRRLSFLKVSLLVLSVVGVCGHFVHTVKAVTVTMMQWKSSFLFYGSNCLTGATFSIRSQGHI